MIIRCTKKLLDLLGRQPEPLGPEGLYKESEWYANLIWIDKRKNLLIVEAETLFAIFVSDVRKADVSPIEEFVTQRIRSELLFEGLPTQLFGSLEASRVRVARTASKSVLGTMNEMTTYIRHAIFQDGGLQLSDSAELNRALRRSLHRGPDYIVPIDVAAARATAQAKWN